MSFLEKIKLNNKRVYILGGSGLIDSKVLEKQFIKNYEKKVPLKRLGDTEEAANVVTFVASDDSSYITGSNILVDGGWTII